jgi:hypothetical protein
VQANSKDERLEARGGVGGTALTYVKKENQHAKQEGYGDENRCVHVCLHVRVCVSGRKGSSYESTRVIQHFIQHIHKGSGYESTRVVAVSSQLGQGLGLGPAWSSSAFVGTENRDAARGMPCLVAPPNATCR